ncbi:hypothetical protein CW704_02555 [Candidatus Bathyarchaeota archaeon]|nr:MAG: hypothetical protein CW704_02555 [Candidatus Bathyarchaeota archaeon]
MSYKSRGHREYDVRRMHLQFRNIWEQGLTRTSQLIRELRSKGWDVDESLYFSSQAEREARELESEGYMVQKQPAIRWGDEEIYILAYKLAPTCLLSHQQLLSRKGQLPEGLIQKQTSDLLGQERARREICGRRAYHESRPLRGVCWSDSISSFRKDAEEVIEEAGVVAGHWS